MTHQPYKALQTPHYLSSGLGRLKALSSLGSGSSYTCQSFVPATQTNHITMGKAVWSEGFTRQLLRKSPAYPPLPDFLSLMLKQINSVLCHGFIYSNADHKTIDGYINGFWQKTNQKYVCSCQTMHSPSRILKINTPSALPFVASDNTLLEGSASTKRSQQRNVPKCINWHFWHLASHMAFCSPLNSLFV